MGSSYAEGSHPKAAVAPCGGPLAASAACGGVHSAQGRCSATCPASPTRHAVRAAPEKLRSSAGSEFMAVSSTREPASASAHTAGRAALGAEMPVEGVLDVGLVMREGSAVETSLHAGGAALGAQMHCEGVSALGFLTAGKFACTSSHSACFAALDAEMLVEGI